MDLCYVMLLHELGNFPLASMESNRLVRDGYMLFSLYLNITGHNPSGPADLFNLRYDIQYAISFSVIVLYNSEESFTCILLARMKYQLSEIDH